MTEPSALALLFMWQIAALPSRVAVESASDCPAAAEVEARLAALLPPAVEGEPIEKVDITATGDTVHILLSRADGAPIGDRTLTLRSSCADRANVAAVVIAAWEAQQHPELLPPPPPPRARPAAAPQAIERAADPAAAAPRWRTELRAGPALTLAGGTVAPGALLSATFSRGQRLGGRLALAASWPRAVTLADGRARWSRTAVAIGPSLRLGGRRLALDLHVEALAGLIVAEGQGFATDRTDTGVVPGAGAGADLSVRLGHLLLGAGVLATAWPLAARLQGSGSVDPTTTTTTSALPRFELGGTVHVGLSF